VPTAVLDPASSFDPTTQVKVWLGEERAHYYVLSRFLISRSLTVTKIPHLKAVKIALELKKFCVDNGMLDISQVWCNFAFRQHVLSSFGQHVSCPTAIAPSESRFASGHLSF
jgi:hypothetical protein